MMEIRSIGMATFAMALLLVTCGPVAPERRGDASDRAGAESASRKRIVVAMMSDPPTVTTMVTPGAALPGQAGLYQLVHAALSRADERGQRQPVVAEAVPSVENGLWKLLPDGRMETRWSIRAKALWHDGVPVTADDVLFAAAVRSDREAPLEPDLAYDFVDRLEATDSHSVVVHWKRPFIDADGFGPVFPKHLLERPYQEDKSAFVQLPYWSHEFVGTGPYVLRGWVRGSHLVLNANDSYVLGRPNIDEIEVRFLADPTTLAANLLAGAVDLTLGKSLSLEQAMQVQDQWRSGRMQTVSSNAILIYPQFLNSRPAIVTDERFRKALMHGTDRQELADTIMYGQSTAAESFFSPSEPEYHPTFDAVVRYAYDPSLGQRMLGSLGYAKGTDGLLRDARGQHLAVEIRTNHVDINQKALFAVADQWQRLGLKVDPVPMSAASQTDAEYVTTFPAFLLYRQPSDVNGLKRQHRSQTPLPENRFRGGNYSRYQNPDLSDLIDNVFMTIPSAERTELLREVVHHISDQLIRMGLFYDVQPTMVANRLTGALPDSSTSGERTAGNAHLWRLE